MESERRRHWLKKEVSFEYVIGLALAAAWWIVTQNRDAAAAMAQVQQTIGDIPAKIEARNRSEDKLQQCLERQIDLVREIKNERQ